MWGVLWLALVEAAAVAVAWRVKRRRPIGCAALGVILGGLVGSGPALYVAILSVPAAASGGHMPGSWLTCLFFGGIGAGVALGLRLSRSRGSITFAVVGLALGWGAVILGVVLGQDTPHERAMVWMIPLALLSTTLAGYLLRDGEDAHQAEQIDGGAGGA